MKKLVVLCVFLSLATSVTAQHAIQIRGKIMDAESGSPLPYATVFVNNTTIGTNSDSLGNYSIRNLHADQPDLIFSFVGYESQHHAIIPRSDTDVVMEVRLQPMKKLLDQIVVEGKSDKQWKKYYKRFFMDFFGETPNAALCEISNPGVLSFSEDENFNFRAQADQPLEIFNYALGYKILVNLRSFSARNKNYSAAYYAQFTELKPRDSRESSRWRVGRLKSYKGSPRHFFKSLIDGRSEKEGYRIYSEGRRALIRVPGEILLPQKATDAGFRDYFKLLQQGTFVVHYLDAFTPKIKRVYSDFEYPVSWLTIYNEFLLCPASGLARPNSNFSWSGAMSGYRIADQLPDDYDPVASEGSLYLERQLLNGSVSGVVRDFVHARAIEGAQVFLNNTLYQTRTDSSGKFELNNVPEGIYELVAAQSEFSLHHQKIEVKQDSVAHAQLSLLQNDIFWVDSIPRKATLAYFNKYVLRGRTEIRVLNPWVLRVGVSHGSSQLKTTDPIELKDVRRGYMMHYYLENLDASGKIGGQIIGFTSFDMLSTKKDRIRNKWEKNRAETYRGSVNHFLRSLAEHRAQEEGFVIYSTLDSIGRQRKVSIRLDAEVLVVKTRGSMLQLNIPRGTMMRFENHGRIQIQTVRNVLISPFGVLSDPDAFKLEGRLKVTNVPTMPLDYQPFDDSIRNPQVWELIRKNQR